MKVLLSIKPEHAAKIFSGEKKYEFRRVIFKNTAVTRVVVYASSPVQKVIGEFNIETVITSDLQSLWQQTKARAGIEEDFFFNYLSTRLRATPFKLAAPAGIANPCVSRKILN